MNNEFFNGGVIYIDLRGYTDIVEEKPLENIAEIIHDYQTQIKQLAKKNFLEKDIATIEYMGDGVLMVIRNKATDDSSQLDEDKFIIELYQKANSIKKNMSTFVSQKKTEYPHMNILDKLDFGMGVAYGLIYQRTSQDNRQIFFGTSLNRAAKIGDAMNKDRNNLGIALDMFQRFGYDYFPLDGFEKKRTSLERQSYVWIK